MFDVIDKNSWCWKGIHYATPPIGPIRWKAPIDPTPWHSKEFSLKLDSEFTFPLKENLRKLGIKIIV